MTMYQIKIQGHLDCRLESLFEGFHITHNEFAEGQVITILKGYVTP